MPTYEVEVSFRDVEVLAIDANNEEDAEAKALSEMRTYYEANPLLGEFKVEGIIEVVI